MRKLFLFLFLSLLMFFGNSAQSQILTKDSRVPAAGILESEASQVLILATTHLKSYEDDFNRDVLNGLLDTLERYHPDLIAIETVSPLFVRDMFNAGKTDEKIRDMICGLKACQFGEKVRAALGVTWAMARDNTESYLDMLESSDREPEVPYLRQSLILNFLAMNDMYSALLQWSYLPEESRRGFESLDSEIHEFFEEHINSPNENVSIGIFLARRLGYQRLHAVNDHRDKEDFFRIENAFIEAFDENAYIKTQPWEPFLEELDNRQEKAYEGGDLLPFYLWMNSRDYMMQDLNNQWMIMFEARIRDELGRRRVAYWDVRNLGIASNIRRVLASHPGEKMLVVIGASHKLFLDALLEECMDVKLIHLKDLVSKKR